MSLNLLYYRDSKGNIVPVEFDLAADSAELGERIKAAVAKQEEDNISPIECAVPALSNTSTSIPVSETLGDRVGVAPERRDSTQIPSVKDVEKIQKQEARRSFVKTWLSNSHAGNQGSPTAQDHQRSLSTQEQTESQLHNDQVYVNLEEAASASRVLPCTAEDDRESELTASPSLPRPQDATPTSVEETEAITSEVAGKEPFKSAYEMTHELEEISELEMSERQSPKRKESTSMANVMTFYRKAAEFDNESITATMGSKKTVESIYDGISIKELSLSERKNRDRGATLGDKVRSLMPRRSSSKLSNTKKNASPTESSMEEAYPAPRHKRGSSTSSLAPPYSDSISTQIYNTSADRNGYLNTDDRHGSMTSDAAGPVSPLNRLRRSLSRGEKMKSFTEIASTPHIVGLMRKEGGPPVSTALVSPLHEGSGFDESAFDPVPDDEDEDDGDEESEGASEKNVGRKIEASNDDLSTQTIPVVPNFDGFKDHVLNLNPHMASFLADRVAQEQVRRFKELKCHRFRHAQDIHKGQCASGRHCPALGGQPTYLPARSKSKGEKTQVFLVKGQPDADEPGATPINFQRGIPEPPVDQLPAIFECPFCFKERKAMNKPSDWTKHVHEDLQPFTCTFRTCSTEKKSFKRKADWVRHENECHRHLEEWRCNYPECQHICYRSDNFSQHLIREHKVPDFKNKTRGSISSKIRAQPKDQDGQEEELMAKLHKKCHSFGTREPDSEPCAFCGMVSATWKKHQVHLSKHMESIALPVLGLISKEEVSQDTMISSIKREQVQPLMGSSVMIDMMATREPHTPTPYSTNESSLHPGSSASQSPLGFLPDRQVQPSLIPYPMDTASYHPGSSADQSPMSMTGFGPRQTLTAMADGTYGALGFGPNQMSYSDINSYLQNEQDLQHSTSAMYKLHGHLHSVPPVDYRTPKVYQTPNIWRSPAQNQLQPPTSYPVADQTFNYDCINSPHSGTSYHRSASPSPHQMRALPLDNQLENSGRQAQGHPILGYSDGEYMSTYAYTKHQDPYKSPLEAEDDPDDFQQSVDTQSSMANTVGPDYKNMAITAMPIDDMTYDQYFGKLR